MRVTKVQATVIVALLTGATTLIATLASPPSKSGDVGATQQVCVEAVRLAHRELGALQTETITLRAEAILLRRRLDRQRERNARLEPFVAARKRAFIAIRQVMAAPEDEEDEDTP